MKKVALIGLLLGFSLAGFSNQTNINNKVNLAIVNKRLVNVHKSPSQKSKLVSQIIYGDLVAIIREESKWALIEINNQPDYKKNLWSKYRGWIKLATINKIAPSIKKRYLSNRAVLINCHEGLYVNISRREGNSFIHSQIVMQGTILPILATNGKMLKLLLPSGSIGYINKKNAIFLNKKKTLNNRRIFLKTIYKFIGKNYIWGGITPLGVDCSGLVYFAARSAGIILPRDTDPQFKALQPINFKNIKLGDLIYFSNNKQKASHVGIYLGKNSVINAENKKIQISNLNNKQLSSKIIGFRTLTLKKIVKKQTIKKATRGLYGQYFMSLYKRNSVLKIIDILNQKFAAPIYIVPFWNKNKMFYRIFGGFYNSENSSPRLMYKKQKTIALLIKKGFYKNKVFSIQIAALRDPYIMIKKLKELSKKYSDIWLKFEKSRKGILWSSLLCGHFDSFRKAKLAYKSKRYQLEPKPYIRKFKVK